MSDLILDDVKKLLDAEIGDKKILEQIKRAAENNEVISNHERNYVSKLVEENLKPPEPEPHTEPIPEDTIEADEKGFNVIEPISNSSTIQSKEGSKKNKKILIGGVAVVLVAIIAVSIGLSGLQEINLEKLTTQVLSIDIDQSSYDKGDIISISGKSKSSLGKTISLQIENSDGRLIWTEDVGTKDSGDYSTLTIAGGPGWEKSGTYKLKVIHDSEDSEISFSFKK